PQPPPQPEETFLAGCDFLFCPESPLLSSVLCCLLSSVVFCLFLHYTDQHTETSSDQQRDDLDPVSGKQSSEPGRTSPEAPPADGGDDASPPLRFESPLMAETPTSLCCCRRSPPASGPRCAAAPPGPGTPRRPRVDVASASNFSSFRLHHFHLDLRVNFAVKELSGWLVLDLEPVQTGIQTLVLDSHPSVLVHAVDCKGPGAGRGAPLSLTFRVDPFSDYGSALSISLPEGGASGQRVHVTVRYTATDGPA
ncbi:aminopeptidase RNPEPL1-like, partial [Etheostoma cragini]|uniref:aminopeptidase RNPEPL1-like n=1 Tax=Etheostoma cragini TaxID=417921 RepID=UPI00155E7085